MKGLHNYFLIILMLVSVSSFAQEEEEKKEKKSNVKRHEIRIIAENFLGNSEATQNYQVWYSSNFSNTGTYEYYNNKFNYGIGYNLNFNKFGIRTKAFYNSYNDTYFDATGLENNSKAQLLRVSAGLNYQKHLGEVTLFFGIDLSYFKIDLEQNQISANSLSFPDISQFTNYKGIGIEPLVGFKYFLSEHFSFSSEVRFIRDNYKGNTLITYNNFVGFGVPDYEVDFEGNQTKLGPKGSISLNVHF